MTCQSFAGTSLTAQWLGLCAFTVGGVGLIPVRCSQGEKNNFGFHVLLLLYDPLLP